MREQCDKKTGDSVAAGEPAETQRLFIALSLPEEVKARIEEAQQRLRGVVRGGSVRWTRREQFHLTLKFLGKVEARRIEALVAAVREVCAGCPPLCLRAEGAGVFPNPRAPRVIWAGVDDRDGALPRLQATIETAVTGYTDEAPEGRFTGHVTLGRVKAMQHDQARMLSGAIATMADCRFGEWTGASVEIIRSELSSAGSRYTVVASVPLGAGGGMRVES